MQAGFREQPLPTWRRAVLKVGSSLLAPDGGMLSDRHAAGLARFVSASLAAGREVVVVSSGAVAAGRPLVGALSERAAGIAARQALAALGQTRLIALWQGFFTQPVAQVLLTHDDLRNRRRYLNARSTLRELLALGAIPVINENDTVAVDELKLGDNDNLAAIVAALVDADLLLIASDIGGLYTGNPRTDTGARPLDEVDVVTTEIMAMARGTGSRAGTGGMLTKLEAAQKAAVAGIETILFDGTDAGVVELLASGRFRGTRLSASRTRLAARKYWLRHAPAVGGGILIDEGAAAALSSRGASLLPGGVLAADGDFARGDMVEIYLDGDRRTHVGRGVTQYAAVDIRRIARRHTREIEGILGYSYGENVVHRDDLVAGE
ncbi:MAG TPA: glutamate 5-kinase [Luteibacter sp.]|jgi:glutamate 5-kinase|nr:glutamate 5-kinase [Luteibacter sp.]